MPAEPPEAIDYKRLILRLTAHACRFLNFGHSADNEGVIQGTGLSPEDFAINIVSLFAVGKFPHDPSKGTGGLIRHLTIAMERDILDALDRAEHKRAEFLDPIAVEGNGDEPGGAKALADLPGEHEDSEAWLTAEAFKNAIYELVADEPELKEMAIAIFEVNALKPREIASVCMTTTEDIQNRKRRLGRLLEEHDFKPKRTESV
ncbi:MAG: hypothetical protein LAO06_21625 [Acidobacteriia bacterium]|nr:hypothetical protein [Terriglobia bacterium]